MAAASAPQREVGVLVATAGAIAAPDIAPDLLDLPPAGECWSVLYTHLPCEKRVARACEYLGIRHYLPLCEHRTGASRRDVYEVPLFPGYVFACTAPSLRVALLEKGAIVRVIPVRHPRPLLDELRQIRAALELGAALFPGPALECGMRVRVRSGALAGVEGLVAGRWFRRGRARLVLNVTMLARGAAIEIDAHAVELIGSPQGGAAAGDERWERAMLGERAARRSPAGVV